MKINERQHAIGVGEILALTSTVGAMTGEINLALPSVGVQADGRATGLGLFRMIAFGAVVAYAMAILFAISMSANLGFAHNFGQPIAKVHANGAAAAAGLVAGDRIVSVNGQQVRTPKQVADALNTIAPSKILTLQVSRADGVKTVSFRVPRIVPFEALAGVSLAGFLLFLAFLANRGGRKEGAPITFFWCTISYSLVLVGAFSNLIVHSNPVFHLPWMISTILAPALTCHHMLQFPLGANRLPRRQLLLLYVVPILLAVFAVVNQLSFLFNVNDGWHWVSTKRVALLIGANAVVYLGVGAVKRTIRLEKVADQIDFITARWLLLGGVTMVSAFAVSGILVLSNPGWFASGGYRWIVGFAISAGAAAIVMAMTRMPFGSLDTLWRRSTGYLLATGVAAVGYLALVGLLGGAVSLASGGDIRVICGATLGAALLFGPVRGRIQLMVDGRFDRQRAHSRKMLREAAEMAAGTLDLEELQAGVVQKISLALESKGVALYESLPLGGWRMVALEGHCSWDQYISPSHSVALMISDAIDNKVPAEVERDMIVAPVLTPKRHMSALVVEPRAGQRYTEVEIDLLGTVSANLVVALENAQAHLHLRELNGLLLQEVELAEQRRQEISSLKERLEEENQQLIEQLSTRTGKTPVVGDGLKRTFDLVKKVARSDSSVLVQGETGVGKELVARAIHTGSKRRDRPFIIVDCGAISPGLIESILFGHVKGAFTGASQDAQGAFRAADGGTIFLDEIGELPLDMQPKLLRVLQERDVQPVGSTERIPVNVRVVSGTNRDLAKEVSNGGFREDLLYRLQIVELMVPPLRERRGDVEALAKHFLQLHGERVGRPPKRLAEEALTALLDYDWPGNVRELEHAIEAAHVYADYEEIQATDLPIFDKLFKQRGRRAVSPQLQSEVAGAPRAGLKKALQDIEEEELEAALEKCDGNKTKAAKFLGMSRGSFLRRLKRYGLMGPAAKPSHGNA